MSFKRIVDTWADEQQPLVEWSAEWQRRRALQELPEADRARACRWLLESGEMDRVMSLWDWRRWTGDAADSPDLGDAYDLLETADDAYEPPPDWTHHGWYAGLPVLIRQASVDGESWYLALRSGDTWSWCSVFGHPRSVDARIVADALERLRRGLLDASRGEGHVSR